MSLALVLAAVPAVLSLLAMRHHRRVRAWHRELELAFGASGSREIAPRRSMSGGLARYGTL